MGIKHGRWQEEDDSVYQFAVLQRRHCFPTLKELRTVQPIPFTQQREEVQWEWLAWGAIPNLAYHDEKAAP